MGVITNKSWLVVTNAINNIGGSVIGRKNMNKEILKKIGYKNKEGEK